MTKKLALALVCAAAVGATAAPAANAGTVCQTTSNAVNKYAGHHFEQMMVYVGDEITGPVRTACSVTP